MYDVILLTAVLSPQCGHRTNPIINGLGDSWPNSLLGYSRNYAWVVLPFDVNDRLRNGGLVQRPLTFIVNELSRHR